MEGVVIFMDTYTKMNEFDLYKDIQGRTKGEIYLGVVGPVRCGKSTFIKRFMDLCVLPYMKEDYEKKQAQDELPQSAAGRTITTTEPKFVPKEAAAITLGEDVDVKVRLVDCVGYMVEGATGHIENDKERQVQTPWFENPIPFSEAAHIGTEKVIREHSTIGIVITTDGSFGEIPRSQYKEAEEKTINALKRIRKPFVVIVNTTKPYGEEAKNITNEIQNKYNVTAIPMNVEQLRAEDILKILQNVLYEFPLTEIEFYMPKWVELLSSDHMLKKDIIEQVKKISDNMYCIRDVIGNGRNILVDSDYIRKCKIDKVSPETGIVTIYLDLDQKYYYEMISEMIEEDIQNEYQFLNVMKELAGMKHEYVKVMGAVESVRFKGYGVVTPERNEITLEKPELIRHGNKFGVKIKAESPSIHMIRANIETEIAPIVGTEEQAKDLIEYIAKAEALDSGIWDTNIFGKTIEQLVQDGITSKVSMIGEESQMKLQESMQKIVNESNGGMVCIII